VSHGISCGANRFQRALQILANDGVDRVEIKRAKKMNQPEISGLSKKITRCRGVLIVANFVLLTATSIGRIKALFPEIYGYSANSQPAVMGKA